MSEMKTIPDITNCKNGPGCTCWELMCPPCTEEINKLVSKNERLNKWRCEEDCRYTMGDVADISGIHCPPNNPCTRCCNRREIERLTKAHTHQYEMAGLMLRRAEYLGRVIDKAPHAPSCAIPTGNDRRCDCWKSKVERV